MFFKFLKEKIEYSLHPLPEKLELELIQVKEKDQLSKLDFLLIGKLNKFEGYNNFNDNYWLWIKETIDKKGYYSIAAYHLDNDKCIVCNTNFLIPYLYEYLYH